MMCSVINFRLRNGMKECRVYKLPEVIMLFCLFIITVADLKSIQFRLFVFCLFVRHYNGITITLK